eukprot:2218691-Pleurochrysis_carterae.AAC.1
MVFNLTWNAQLVSAPRLASLLLVSFRKKVDASKAAMRLSKINAQSLALDHRSMLKLGAEDMLRLSTR